MVRSNLPTGARGKTFIEKRWKQNKEINYLAMAFALFEKAYLAVGDWLSLGYDFLTLSHFQAWVLICLGRLLRY